MVPENPVYRKRNSFIDIRYSQSAQDIIPRIEKLRDSLGSLKLTPSKTHRLNIQAPFFLAQQVFANMKKHGRGKIINISSITAKYGGSSKSLHYSAAKAALGAITVGLPRAGASHNILVNAVQAGFIYIPLQKRLINEKNLKERIDLIPLNRPGKPEDVSGAVGVYLASEAGDFITEEIMTVSGGN
jgi:NAD(P)-dependent dehydrogenase (short-subunit alcohol dehydrogenase family)